MDEHDVAEAVTDQAEPEAEAIVHLDDWCARKSVTMRGHVELVTAFHRVRTANGHVQDTPSAFEGEFEALRGQPA